MPGSFLPVTPEEVAQRGWDAPDFVYAVGEAYVDHPSFGHAIIGRVLEAARLPRGDALPAGISQRGSVQALWKAKAGFPGFLRGHRQHGQPLHRSPQTAQYRRVRPRADVPACSPDRAVTVYCNRIHEAYPGIPVLIGGVEASLRRVFAL